MAQPQDAPRQGPRQRVAILIGTASGHINPSFPMARQLVEQGHAVHYLSSEQMRAAIEDTGAAYHEAETRMPELYEGREADVFGALASLRLEFGISEDLSWLMGMSKLRNVMLELKMPGVIRFLQEVKATVVVYCPYLNREGAMASQALRIPSVPLLTTAGPGSMAAAWREFLEKDKLLAKEAAAAVSSFQPDQEAMQRMNDAYTLALKPGRSWFEPVGMFDEFASASVAIVTTSEDLQDPTHEDLARVYNGLGVRFEYVGALLDKMGAKRSGPHKFEQQGGESLAPAEVKAENSELIAKVRAARLAGRRIVLVSMGTVVTGDVPQIGWNGRALGADGQPRGLSGKGLCQNAWGGAFDAFGSNAEDEGALLAALLVVSLGPQPDALDGLEVPPNAICMPSVPQVDVLKAGVDLFLTHGGQNSFMEGLSSAVPVLVCPAFGDQIVNSRKAVALGVGLKVDRPDPNPGAEAAAIAQYRASVRNALGELTSSISYATAAARCAERLKQAGGVPRAVELVLQAAVAPAREPSWSKSEALEPARLPAAVCSAHGGA